MSSLSGIFHNPVLINAVLCWVAAQLTKVIIYSIHNGKVELYHIVEDGGMPSAHSATVTSLATSCALLYGFDSVYFAISAVLAVIVMHDAMGVRLESGKQAAVINEIVKNINQIVNDLKTEPMMENVKNLKELIGHTPLQVLFGSLLGLVVTLLAC